MLKPIKEYESRYLIDKKGNVYSLKNKKYLKWQMGPKTAPYPQVNLHNGHRKTQKTFMIHILVAQAFLPPKPSGDNIEINHTDGDRWNNDKDNLEWTTKSGNALHAYHVLHTRKSPKLQGEECGRAKLSGKQVIAIRNERKQGHTLIEIAKRYGVTPQHISYLCKGKGWKILEQGGVSI